MADLPSWSLFASPNTYQLACSTLTSLIQPQSRYHRREIRSPDTRHKNGCFTDLEKEEKSQVNQTACQIGTSQLMLGSYQSPILKMIPAPPPLELPTWVQIYRQRYSKEYVGKYVPICTIFRYDTAAGIDCTVSPLTPIYRTAGSGHAESKKYQEQEQYFTGREKPLQFSRKTPRMNSWIQHCLTVTRKSNQCNQQLVLTEHSSCMFSELIIKRGSCRQRTVRSPRSTINSWGL